MRDYKEEMNARIEFIRTILKDAGAKGIVFGNSGGKDCALVAILCKAACDNTLGLIMPCGSRQNYESDTEDAMILAKQFNIETMTFDLSKLKNEYVELFDRHIELSKTANSNIPPRLRMIALYGVAASQNRLVAGTGNKSERYMGYYTKWGDGAFDFNPIADLTVTEVYEFLRFLKAPISIIGKAPSAGLFDGQTDESEMGISYEKIDNFILNGIASENDKAVISKYHNSSEHKRKMPPLYNEGI